MDIMYCLTLFPYLLGLAYAILPSLFIAQVDHLSALMKIVLKRLFVTYQIKQTSLSVTEGEKEAQSIDYLGKTFAGNSLVRYMEFFVTNNAFEL